MQNPSDDEEKIKKQESEVDFQSPAFDPTIKYSDPVRSQKMKDRVLNKKPLDAIPETNSIISAKITPSMDTRIDLRFVPVPPRAEGQPRTKYIVPKTKKQWQKYEKNRSYTAKKFCKKRLVKVADPEPKRKFSKTFEVPSPEPSSAKVKPRMVSPTSSWLHPDPQSPSELELTKPKSGIMINETEQEQKVTDYDSFDLVYRRKPRPDSRKSKKTRKLEPIYEEGEGERTSRRKRKKRGSLKKSSQDKRVIPEDEFLAAIAKEMEENMMLGEYGEGDFGPQDNLTKQFRRKVSLMSQCTSYRSQDFALESQLSLTHPGMEKYAQKFRTESEIKRYQPKKRRFRRGTLESHSFTNVYQPILKEFYFGCRQGTMHQGDEHISEGSRNMQGICIPVAAYCFSFLKHPNKWSSENIDEILDCGSQLYLSSLGSLHVHHFGRELKPDDLDKYCFIRDRKIRFTVQEPEVVGMIKSTEKTVFNLTKALHIFFARQKAGIFQTQDTNLAIWKDKYFYIFDGKPRTKDLQHSPTGTAVMATFYDIPAIVTVLLQRSGMQNWPFIIYPIKIFKVLQKDAEDDDEKTLGLDARSNYNILNENKAVLLGSYDLGDKCFGFTRSKQSLPLAIVCLVYSRITPPSAWHRTTVDKIMIVGNQLYVECMTTDGVAEMKLSTIPAFFTIGPYIVEIYIYSNRIVNMLYEKSNCQLQCLLEEFFTSNTNGILQIGTSYLAVWKQRNMFYCFDPYPRGTEGYKCRDGYACVSMHSNLESLVDVVSHNFEDKNIVFNLHALKVCKIHRDPVQSQRFPKHVPLDEYPPEEFKKYKMTKSKKSATEKPITVDYCALAMRSLLADQTPDPSIFEIGSHVGSLGLEQIPPLLHPGKPPHPQIVSAKPLNTDIIADLDSPSLSDTQIPPIKPPQIKLGDLSEVDMDTFELTQDEIELEQILGEGFDMDQDAEQEDDQDMDQAELEEAMAQEMNAAAGEGEDFYYTANEYAQVRTDSLQPVVVSEEMNTDMTFFPIRKEILYPTYVRDRQKMKTRYKRRRNEWDDEFYPNEPEVTKSEELKKETNFVDLPDDTQIIRGTKNVSEYGDDVEFIAPFVCVMANVVSKKYAILSWSPEIVDYVLKCGSDLYNASKFRYDQVSKLEIPQISLGKNKYGCLVQYIFDSYMRQNILELAIEKILFIRSDMGVLVTPTYACALIYKNHLYYMYDGFGSNEVGLSEGPSDSGVACFLRFKDIHSLVARIIYNKKKRENNEDIIYTRFVISLVKVRRIHPSETTLSKDEQQKRHEEEEQYADEAGEDGNVADRDTAATPEANEEEEHESEIKVGYQYKKRQYVIEGSRALVVGGDDGENDEEKNQLELQEDHFTCLCACLMLLSLPIHKWDNKRVDEVLDHGNHVYSHADNLEISEKRTIKNILIRKNFFDIIVRKIKIENWKDNQNMKKGIDTLLRKKMNYFIVQFPGGCYVVHKTDDVYHLFYPQGLPKGRKNANEEQTDDGDESLAGWLKCKDLKRLKYHLKKVAKKSGNSYDFYTFEVTSIRKAPKDMLINYKLNQYKLQKHKKIEQMGKPFYEDAEWLKVDPIPWSRLKGKNPEGVERGVMDNMWHNWNIEYSNDLCSLISSIHQDSDRFSEETRGKQTLCNLVMSIAMLEIYDLTEWNSAVMDSILVNGDQYFKDCIKDIGDDDYELSIDDLKPEADIFPFSFKAGFKPVVEGTMFLVRNTQFNLYKALRLFFDHHSRRSGLICCTKSNRKKHVAFGKAENSEYFIVEVDCRGPPMFVSGMERAYALRMTSLNRLLHVLTLTLRGGDFYIFEVKITEVKPIT